MRNPPSDRNIDEIMANSIKHLDKMAARGCHSFIQYKCSVTQFRL